MRVVKGNLLTMAEQGKFDVIVQGCNCFHVMGAGLAAQIKQRYPRAYEADLVTPRGDESKLGTYSSSYYPPFWVINAYTQFGFGMENDPPVNYEAIHSVLSSLSAEMDPNTRFGLPRIGCGLAGGDWERVEDIILETLGDRATVVVWDGSK